MLDELSVSRSVSLGHVLASALLGPVRRRSTLPREKRLPDMQYRVILLRAWSHDALAQKMQDALEGYDQHEIISVQTGQEFILWLFFWVWLRPWAMILVKTLELAD
jgi:hypothetical protein